VNRAMRRAVDRMLRDERCGACGGGVDEHSHEAQLIGPAGEFFAHFICAGCFAEACSGPDGQRRVSARARLALTPTEGSA
jgi:hypothetical protein